MTSASTTPIFASTTSTYEFQAFATEIEPELRRALLGIAGREGVAELVGEALDVAVSDCQHVQALSDPVPALVGKVYGPAKKGPRLVLLDEPSVGPAGSSDSAVIPSAPAALRLDEAFAGMPEPQRSALWLTHGCGWSVERVSRALNRGELMVGSHVGEGLRSLQNAVGGAGAPSPDDLAELCRAAFEQTDVVPWKPTVAPAPATRWKTAVAIGAAVIMAAAILGPRLATTPTFGMRGRADHSSPAEARQQATPAVVSEPTAVPTPVPTAPAVRAGRFVGDAQIIGDRLIVVDSNEVWLSADRAGSWQRLAYPEGAVYDSYSSCFSAIGDRIVVSTAGTGSRKLLVEHPDQKSWDIITVPAAPERANWYWGNRLCTPIDVDGSWVLATTERAGLRVASTADGGATFAQHQILFPPEWVDAGTDFGLGGFVNLYLDRDWVIAQICISRTDSDCPSQEVTFHKSLLATGTQAVIAHDARTDDDQPLIGWSTSERTYTEEIELFQLDRSVWRTEVDGAGDVGLPTPARTWASGPFGGPLAPLPGRPSLHPSDQGVIACVESTGECWIRDHDDTEWKRLNESPIVDWRTLPPGTPATFSEVGDDGVVLVVPFRLSS